jgi:hypothetical protein
MEFVFFFVTCSEGCASPLIEVERKCVCLLQNRVYFHGTDVIERITTFVCIDILV